MSVMIAGCGKKEDKALADDNVVEEVQDSIPTTETTKVEAVAEKDDDIVVSKEDVQNLNAYIRTVNKLAKDKLNRNTVEPI